MDGAEVSSSARLLTEMKLLSTVTFGMSDQATTQGESSIHEEQLNRRESVLRREWTSVNETPFPRCDPPQSRSSSIPSFNFSSFPIMFLIPTASPTFLSLSNRSVSTRSTSPSAAYIPSTSTPISSRSHPGLLLRLPKTSRAERGSSEMWAAGKVDRASSRRAVRSTRVGPSGERVREERGEGGEGRGRRMRGLL